MKQVVQNYRSGELSLQDVPGPVPKTGGLLVQTVASAVSAGTEKSKVDLARKNLVGKALARPDQVRKVLDTLKKEGFRSTFDKISNKLDSLSPLGYSAAGRVVTIGDDCDGFSVGDAVACAGAGFANHAELIWVPQNLCALIPSGVTFDDAAFTTIGAIALHGVRQAEATFGETVAVIGLGLLGQLTAQLLRACGCRVIGIDVDPWKVDLAKQYGFHALERSQDVIAATFAVTDGRGADSVIITAAAASNDPVVLAGDIARDRAHVVMVGAVPLDVPRSPYYEKELDVRLSRSYGPGRYDRRYEEKGFDYPVGYVRWTENRNMQAFLQALAGKQITLDKLITHRIQLDEVERAYALVTGEISERFLGVLLKYPEDAQPSRAPVQTDGVISRRAGATIGFIGAGSFAGGTLIPLLKDMPGVTLAKVCTASGLTARDIAIRHEFGAAVGDPDDIISDPKLNVVFIASRHDSHANLTASSLAAGKAVFVEKPLALGREELDQVMAAAATNGALTVGFNRRFSPHTERVQELFANRAGALVINIRVNAGPIPPDSWIHDPRTGGGRIMGEACHFIDLAHAIAGERIERVYASGIGLPDPASRLRDNVSITLELAGGSLANIVYTSKGDMALGKERIEVFGSGMSAVIDDFITTTLVRKGKTERFKTKQDKGHREELRRFIQMVTAKGATPIPLEELRISTLATLAAVESLDQGNPVTV